MRIDRVAEKYPSYSPYHYAANNPICFVDLFGDSLDVGSDKEKSIEYIKSILPEGDRERLIVNDNGRVTFNTDGLDLTSDAAYELLNNLVSSSENFIFEVADGTTDSNGKTTYSTEDNAMGIFNFSKTGRYNNCEDCPKGVPSGPKPRNGYDGQVTLGTGSWNFLNTDGGGNQPLANIVFHELWENFERTKNKEPYIRPDGSGAHQRAIDATKGFKGQSGTAGRGEYKKPSSKK